MKRNNKEGAALLLAIVIMMIVMMLAFSLLLVSSSLSSITGKLSDIEQCDQLTKDISREFDRELLNVSYDDNQKMVTALKANTNPLWCYLRCNLWQTKWPYYNPEERGHSSSNAYRYFKISDFNADWKKIVDDVEIKMYWESEADASKSADTSFYIEVTCKKGKAAKTILSNYKLVIETNVNGYTDSKDIDVTIPGNPQNFTINTKEKWTFNPPERE